MKKIQQALRRISSFFDIIPITFSALLLVVLFVFAYSYLTDNYNLDEISAQAVFFAIGKYLLLFLAAVVSVSFLSSIVAYIVFYVRAKNNKKYLNVSFNFDDSNVNKVVSKAKIKIQKLLLPLFGTVKIRFTFENNFITKKYVLSSKRFKLFSTKQFESECTLDFADVQNYVLKSVKFYFEDYFSLFSFSQTNAANTQFYILPSPKKSVDIVPNPITQRETRVRTNIMRYLPGEYFRFKDFENSDDVRRIVWKIYAKNKELVVRTQELRTNYASKLMFYASFFNNKDVLLQSGNFSRAFLTYYKNAIWGIYSQLKKDKKMDLAMKFDQQINVAAEDDSLPAEMFEISAADWQNSLSPDDFYKIGDVSILCISSFVSADDVAKLLNKTNNSTIVVFVKLSDALKSNVFKLLLNNIFVKPKRGSLDELHLKFLLSPLRKRLLANEKKIIELLNKEDDIFHIV